VKWWQPRHLNEWKARAAGPAAKKSGGIFSGLRGPRRGNLTVTRGGVTDRSPGRPPSMVGRRDEERLLDEVDRVLDKISREGIAALTPEERKLLDDVSRRYRSN
jgi:hypothetical protein